ncbi:hypothetical protein TCE0_033r09472 [Talaromyces pinophilus]|uniref:Uncharacterized protein n=1 Tax=Talaromyces pinophilus TaxID=128442 RepID=A0A6V8HBD8_TALPI|nr:hypothetical protein TCE0_033r09472 [Talaromyces pinophilus]
MSFGPKADEAEMSHQSGDEHDITSTDVEPAGVEDAGSMIAEPDNDNYQNLHPAEIDTATPNVGGDIAHGPLSLEVASSNEILSIDLILELNDAEHGHYNADAGAGAARADGAQDFANVGAMFPDEALHIDPVLNIE